MTALLVSLIIGVCFAVHVAVGFGGGLLALPILSLLIGVKNSITLILIFQTLTGLQIFWLHRQVPFAKLRLFIPGAALGVMVGVYFLSRLPERPLEMLVGIYLLLYVIADFFEKRLSKFMPDHLAPVFVPMISFGGGLISGAIGTGGPVFVSYLKKQGFTKESLRSTIIFMLLVNNLIRIAATAQFALFTPEVLKYALWALPLFAAGAYGGYKLMKKLDEKQFHLFINILLLISGLALLFRPS